MPVPSGKPNEQWMKGANIQGSGPARVSHSFYFVIVCNMLMKDNPLSYFGHLLSINKQVNRPTLIIVIIIISVVENDRYL